MLRPLLQFLLSYTQMQSMRMWIEIFETAWRSDPAEDHTYTCACIPCYSISYLILVFRELGFSTTNNFSLSFLNYVWCRVGDMSYTSCSCVHIIYRNISPNYVSLYDFLRGNTKKDLTRMIRSLNEQKWLVCYISNKLLKISLPPYQQNHICTKVTRRGRTIDIWCGNSANIFPFLR